MIRPLLAVLILLTWLAGPRAFACAGDLRSPGTVINKAWTPQITARALAEQAAHLYPSTLNYVFKGNGQVRDAEVWREMFLASIEDGMTVMELGASVGRSVTELATLRRVKGIAVDVGDHVRTQSLEILKQSPIGKTYARSIEVHWDRTLLLLGSYHLEVGYAEDVLPKYEGELDFVWDVFGAFSYSPTRVLLLERIYRALSPRGQARLYCEWEDCMKVAKIMAREFPSIFDLRALPQVRRGFVLVMRKDPAIAVFNSGWRDGRVLAWTGELGVPSVRLERRP